MTFGSGRSMGRCATLDHRVKLLGGLTRRSPMVETMMGAVPVAKDGPVLRIDGLSKRYGTVTALDDASFEVYPGRVVGFLGPNGAGKTTAMRCILGLVDPDDGAVTYGGNPVDADMRLRFGYMPEERGLYPKMRIGEQLAYFGRLSGLAPAAATDAAQSWLMRLGLADRSTSLLEQLSHGNQQRVQLAAALVHSPRVAVLDEPFAGLDPLGVETMGEVLRELSAAGTGVLFSSHQLDLVEDVCQDVVIIERGRVVLAGVLDELREAAPIRQLELDVDGRPWAHPMIDERREVIDGHVVHLVDSSIDLDAVVRTAEADGRITRLRFEPPTLTDLFREAMRS
jgi:ABC-2 type transport system ATP-binding protein